MSISKKQSVSGIGQALMESQELSSLGQNQEYCFDQDFGFKDRIQLKDYIMNNFITFDQSSSNSPVKQIQYDSCQIIMENIQQDEKKNQSQEYQKQSCQKFLGATQRNQELEQNNAQLDVQPLSQIFNRSSEQLKLNFLGKQKNKNKRNKLKRKTQLKIQKKEENGKKQKTKYADIERVNKKKKIGKRKNKNIGRLSASKQKQIKRQKNETKNIIKNYGKSIITFVHKNKDTIENILSSLGSAYTYQFIDKKLQQTKNKMAKIENLRSQWNERQYSKQLRVISQYILKKHSPHWIFNSRIQDYTSTIKYRNRLLTALKLPEKFQTLKWP